MSKWISVKKNPPEDMVEVILLLSRDVHPLIASGHRRHKMFNLDRIENADTYMVTHWMPLPKLPKDI